MSENVKHEIKGVNAFYHYILQNRDELYRKNLNLNCKTRYALLARNWKCLSKQEKAKYKEMALIYKLQLDLKKKVHQEKTSKEKVKNEGEKNKEEEEMVIDLFAESENSNTQSLIKNPKVSKNEAPKILAEEKKPLDKHSLDKSQILQSLKIEHIPLIVIHEENPKDESLKIGKQKIVKKFVNEKSSKSFLEEKEDSKTLYKEKQTLAEENNVFIEEKNEKKPLAEEKKTLIEEKHVFIDAKKPLIKERNSLSEEKTPFSKAKQTLAEEKKSFAEVHYNECKWDEGINKVNYNEWKSNESIEKKKKLKKLSGNNVHYIIFSLNFFYFIYAG